MATLLVPRDGRSRARLDVWVRHRKGHGLRCGRCGEIAPGYDRGGRDGWQRRWRHVDAGYVACDLIGDAPRVQCPTHRVTVAQVVWARHGSPYSRAFEDLVVHDAIMSNKAAAAARYQISWRAVNNACVRVAEEALGRVDLLDGLAAIAIDEVKYKRGHRPRTGLLRRRSYIRTGRQQAQSTLDILYQLNTTGPWQPALRV